jgi:hypothetical protein
MTIGLARWLVLAPKGLEAVFPFGDGVFNRQNIWKPLEKVVDLGSGKGFAASWVGVVPRRKNRGLLGSKQNMGYIVSIVVIFGLPDAAVKESRDRVSTALTNSGFKFPLGRTTINLAPTDVRKEGPSFDLPIALGMLAANNQLISDRLDHFVMERELALTGQVPPMLIRSFKKFCNLLLAFGSRLLAICFPAPQRFDADA